MAKDKANDDKLERLDFTSSDSTEKLIARFGGLRPFANSLGIAVGTVQGWKQRNSIPLAHQKRIRELLSVKSEGEGKTGGKKKPSAVDLLAAASQPSSPSETPTSKPISTPLAGSPLVSTPIDDSSSDEQVAIEESLVSAFTSENSLPGDEQDSDSDLNISRDIWEHASLPRSTSGHWAILISCIALIGVLTRPLWAERIDAKLMATIAGESHSTESHNDITDGSSEGKASEVKAEEVKDEEVKDGDGEKSSQQDEDNASNVDPDLLERLLQLEKAVSSVSENNEVLAVAEMRRLKSESSALAAAFDSQAARLDSLNKLLQEREEALASLRKKVELVEQNDASAKLTQRLNALFELENIAYEIAQNTTNEDFSLRTLKQALEQALPAREYETLSRSLTKLETLGQANMIPTPRQLLSSYRLLLPDLLAMQARSDDAGLGERLRAQLFSIFSIRRRGAEIEQNPLLKVEQLLEDHSSHRAEKLLLQATAAWLNSGINSGLIAEALQDGTESGLGADNAPASDPSSDTSSDPSSLRSRLLSFQSMLSARNEVFVALREIRQRLISDSELNHEPLIEESLSEDLPEESSNR